MTEAGFTDTPTGRLKLVIAARHAITQAHWHAEEDAHPTLETLRGQGYRLGLISNAGDALDVQTLVDQARLRRYSSQYSSAPRWDGGNRIRRYSSLGWRMLVGCQNGR